jgi:anti-sigma factor RsiW
MKHAEITELLGAWALDAVDPDEAATVELHLATCPRCRHEVAQHRDVAARLAFDGELAPEGVWDRIAASLEESPPPLDMGTIVPIESARRRSGRLTVRVAMAIGAAAAVVIAALGLEVGRLDNRTRQLTAAVKRGEDVGRIATEAGTRSVSMRSADGEVTATAYLADGGVAAIDGRQLPPLPSDREYQLWGIDNGTAVSLRLLGDRPGFVTFRVGSGVDHLAVSDEPAGGQVSPADVIVSGAV